MRALGPIRNNPGFMSCRPQRARWGVIVVMLLCATTHVTAAETAGPGKAGATDGGLGTLFYTIAEREAIVQARQGQVDAPLRSTRMTVNGLVKRQGANQSTAWINGQAVVDGNTLPLAGRVGVQRRGVLLDDKPMRVGESLDVITQVHGDIVAPGAVTRKGKP